jgi:hypothetical protein
MAIGDIVDADGNVVTPAAPPPPTSTDGGPTSDADSSAGAFGYGVIKGIPGGSKIAAAGNAGIGWLARKADEYGLLNEDQKKAVAGLPQDYTSASEALATKGGQAAEAHPWLYAGGQSLPMIMTPGAATAKGAAIYGGALGAGEGESVGGSLVKGTLGAAGGAGGAALANSVLPAVGGVARQTILDAAKRLNVTMPRYSVGLPITQMAGKLGFSIPGAAAPLEEGTAKSIEGLGDAATQAAAGATTRGAGKTASTSLKNWIGPTSQNIVDQRYAYANSLMNQRVQSPISNTVGAFNQIMGKRGAYGEKMTGPVAKLIQDANNVPGGLTYNAMKDLRTRLGSLTDSWGQVGPKELEDNEVEHLWGALSGDLTNAARRAGGQDAVDANNTASATFKAITDNRQRLQELLGGSKMDAQPENVFGNIQAAAQPGKAGDLDLLQRAQQAVPANDWDQISRGFVSNLGRDPTDGSFSTARFLTGYSKIDDKAKDILFNQNPALRQNLDDLATVSQQWKSLGRYANPTHSGMHAVGPVAMVEGARHPAEAITAFLGFKAMGKFLASPAGSGAVTNWTRAVGSGNAEAIRNAAVRTAATAGAQLGAKIDPKPLAAWALQHYTEHEGEGAGDQSGNVPQ